MKITQKCPYCYNNMKYFKDLEVEKLGMYAFDCVECNTQFMTPKDSPLIQTEAENYSDCLDCANSENKGVLKHNWICKKGHNIPKDKHGIVEILDHECKDFELLE